MKLLSKISIKAVYGNIDIKKLTEVGEMPLVRIMGIANGTKTGQSNFGEWTAFTGNFKAINLETGADYRSGKAFIPAIAENLVVGALGDANADSVQFAFDIGVKSVKDRQGKDSYEYTVTPLVEAADNDPLSELEKKVSSTHALEDKTKAKK